MAARDDFGSGARSPGGWGGQGNMRTAAGGGGHGSLGGAAGRNGSGMGGLGGVGGGAGSIRPEAMPYAVREGKGPWPGGYATPVLRKPVPPPTGLPVANPVVAALARRLVTPETAPQGEQYPEGVSPGLNNPFVRGFPANPGGQFGPRTYNDGYQTVRADKFQNNPAYGSPGGGLGQYNNQTTVNQNNQGMGGLGGGAGRGGGWNTNAGKFGGPR